MFSFSKSKQLNIFEQVSELSYMIPEQPVGFVKLLADNFDINTFLILQSSNINNILFNF